MWPGLFALFGILLLVGAAVFAERRPMLALLGAALLATAVTWPYLTAIGG